MNATHIILLPAIISLLNVSSFGAETIAVDPDELHQTIYGFGAGMKRQEAALHDLAEPARTEVLNLMFRDVDTRILRHFLRHDQEETNDNLDPYDLNLSALEFEKWYYEDQFWVLEQAQTIAGDKIDTFYASCNTAPPWMKTNTNEVGGTLETAYYTEFAEFLWGYLYYFQTVKGFPVRALSIFNEPSFEVTHESMNPTAAECADILAAVRPYLDDRFAETPQLIKPLILAPDCLRPTKTVAYLNTILANPAASNAIDVIGSHYYGNDGIEDWNEINGLADGKPVWQTEWSQLSGASDDIDDGLNLARKMHDVLDSGSEAYVAFQWVKKSDDATSGNGLIRIGTDLASYVVPKRYHVFKQFANTIPRGAILIGTTASTPNLAVTSYLSPGGSNVIIQVINDSGTGFPDLEFSCPGMLDGDVRRIRTGANNDAKEIASVTGLADSFTDTVYANTFTTYIVAMDVPPPPVVALVVDFHSAAQVLVESSWDGADRVLDTAIPYYSSANTNYTYTGPDIYNSFDDHPAALLYLRNARGTSIRMNAVDTQSGGADALALFKTASVSFETGADILNATAGYSQQARLATAEIRFVVEDAGSYYISDASTNLPDTYTIHALTANWYAYDPTTLVGMADFAGTAAAPTFQDIGFVGFQWLVRGDINQSGGAEFGVSDFTVTAMAEPAASGFDAFVSTYGLANGPLGDADSDGLLDYGEYVFGGIPTNASDRGTQPVFDAAAGNYVFSLIGDSSVVAYVLTNQDLVNGSWGTNATVSVTATNGALGAYTNNVGTTWTNLFMKLKLKTP
ncbi:MAG: hypothetical protein K9M45_05720 [Kiritimatiellales bacterium]|nr:hypothetical protein [Kiritimatiellales bacterium]